MIIKKLLRTCWLLSFLVSPLCFAKTLSNPEFTTWLTNTMQQRNIPGVSIAIVHDYQIDEANGFGHTQAATQNPVTADTLFQAGEISSALAATVALDTVYQSKLSLHPHVNRFLKSWRLPDNEFTHRRALTVGRILNGSSGTNVATLAATPAQTPAPTLLQLLKGESPASNPAVAVITTPGLAYHPTIGSYLILQQLLEDIYHESYAQLIAKKIFSPLHMKHSRYTDPQATSADNAGIDYARPHTDKGFVIETGPAAYTAQAALGLWTTPSELAKWMIAVQKAYTGNTQQILPTKMAKKLLNADLTSRDPRVLDASLGLIVNLNRHGEKQAQGQYFKLVGTTPGYQSLLFGNKNTGDGVIIMVNKTMTTEDDDSAVLSDILTQIVEHEKWQDKTA